jgi:hypothetical protein
MMIRNSFFIILAFILAVFLIPDISVPAADNIKSRSTLRGIEGVSVQIENLDADLKQELRARGFSEHYLQTRVERELVEAGIKVIPQEGGQKSANEIILYLNLQLLKPQATRKYRVTPDDFKLSEDGGSMSREIVPKVKGDKEEKYFYALQVEVRQTASLLRDPNIKELTTTWSTSSVAYRLLSRIEADIVDQVGRFVSAYSTANTK